jgi:hypothetical protein
LQAPRRMGYSALEVADELLAEVDQ